MNLKLLLLALNILFMIDVSAEDNFFSAIETKLDRYALSVFDNAVHKGTLYIKTFPKLLEYFKGVGTWIEDLDEWWSTVATFLVTLPEEKYDP